MPFWLSFQILSHVFLLQDTHKSKCSESYPARAYFLLIGLLVDDMKVEKNGILHFIRALTIYIWKLSRCFLIRYLAPPMTFFYACDCFIFFREKYLFKFFRPLDDMLFFRGKFLFNAYTIE